MLPSRGTTVVQGAPNFESTKQMDEEMGDWCGARTRRKPVSLYAGGSGENQEKRRSFEGQKLDPTCGAKVKTVPHSADTRMKNQGSRRCAHQSLWGRAQQADRKADDSPCRPSRRSSRHICLSVSTTPGPLYTLPYNPVAQLSPGPVVEAFLRYHL